MLRFLLLFIVQLKNGEMKAVKLVAVLLVTSLWSVKLLAQDAMPDEATFVPENNDSFISSPWVWITCAAIVILILVLLTRNQQKS